MEEKRKEDNSFGVTSLIFGVLSIIFSISMIPSLVFGALGLIFGIIQFRKARNNWAIWGIVLSAIGIVLSIIVILLVVNLVAKAVEEAARIKACTENISIPGCVEILQKYGLTPKSTSELLGRLDSSKLSQFSELMEGNGGINNPK